MPSRKKSRDKTRASVQISTVCSRHHGREQPFYQEPRFKRYDHFLLLLGSEILTCDTDKDIRDNALDSLRTYLGGRSEISELDLLKLWKGLFYCTLLGSSFLPGALLRAAHASLSPAYVEEPLLISV